MSELIKFGNIECKLGSKDLIKPKTIKGNVIEFGIIKCLRSIKYIMINDKLKIISNNDVSVRP